MDKGTRLLEVRSARAGVAAATVVALRGNVRKSEGGQVLQLMLDGMRIMLQSKAGYPRLFLTPAGGGYGLCLQVSHGPRVWLIAERSKRLRVFKRIETALRVCRDLGADQVVVRFSNGDM